MSNQKVQVYVYDLTRGMAAALSPMLLGQQIAGVWHTGVVVDGQEIFFGYGINKARAGSTMFGAPHHIIDVGTTEIPQHMRDELLADLAPRFRPEDYNLLWHNCNHFSHEFSQLLTGEGLPDYILNQAQVVFNTPWGESLMPMIMAMEGFTGRATSTGLASPEAAAYTPAATEASAAAAAAAAMQAAAVEQQRSHSASACGSPSTAAEAAAQAATQTISSAMLSTSSGAAQTEQQKDVASSSNHSGGFCVEDVVGSTGVGQGEHSTSQVDSADKVSGAMTVLQLTADSRAGQEH